MMFSGVPIWGVMVMCAVVVLAIWFLWFSSPDYDLNSSDRVVGMLLFVLGLNSAGFLTLLTLVSILHKIGWIQ
tara:strand:+ start:846 stop:1064 length:219 start_codon:yes stop_codon:yes gene_type:complete